MTKIDFVNMDDPNIVFGGSTKKSEQDVAHLITNKKPFILTNEATGAVFVITSEFMSKYLCVFTTRIKEKPQE